MAAPIGTETTLSLPNVGKTTILSLPNELLSNIFRIATKDEESLAKTYKDPFVLATYRFSEYDRSYEHFKDKLSLSLVNRRFNALSAPFLYEYIYCSTGIARLYSVIACLERVDHGVERQRGYWAKRVDIWVGPPIAYGREPSEILQEELQLWSQIISLTPNAIIVDVATSPEHLPCEWSTVLFSLSTLQNLRRVEWNDTQTDLADLQQLSLLCPSLAHLSVSISPGAFQDSEISTNAFIISFPHLETLILNWNQSNPQHANTIYPQFQPWDLPSLKHFGYFLRRPYPFHMILPLLESLSHLRSLELPVLGKNELIILPSSLLPSLPNLDTLLIDVFKTQLPFTPCPTHNSLKTLGWRLRLGSAFVDIRRLAACPNYFTRESFPNLEKIRIVHPIDWMDYANNMTTTLVDYWGMLIEMAQNGTWLPIVDFEEEPLEFLETGNDEFGDEENQDETQEHVETVSNLSYMCPLNILRDGADDRREDDASVV